jgi:hypothetical protein
MSIEYLKGLTPKMNIKLLWNMYNSKKVPKDFRFRFSRSLLAGYVGFAVRDNL